MLLAKILSNFSDIAPSLKSLVLSTPPVFGTPLDEPQNFTEFFVSEKIKSLGTSDCIGQ